MADPKTKLCEYCEEREIEEGKVTKKYRVCSQCKYGVHGYIFHVLKTAVPHHKWKMDDGFTPMPFFSKTLPGLVVVYDPDKRRWWARFRLRASEKDGWIQGEYKSLRYSNDVAHAIRIVTSSVLNKLSNKLAPPHQLGWTPPLGNGVLR